MKIGGRAHAAFAQFVIQRPATTFTAVQIVNAVAEGFSGARKSLVPGDHAIKPDGSPAYLRPNCNCAKDPGKALFVGTEGPDGKWQFTTRKDARSIADVFKFDPGYIYLDNPGPQPKYHEGEELETVVNKMALQIVQRCA